MTSNGEAKLLPGVAPVAMQQGRHAASVIRARLAGRPHEPFRYRDKGNLATIGRAAAVADIHGLKLSGFLAWMTWLLVHLWYLIGFQNRLLVLIRVERELPHARARSPVDRLGQRTALAARTYEPRRRPPHEAACGAELEDERWGHGCVELDAVHLDRAGGFDRDA